VALSACALGCAVGGEAPPVPLPDDAGSSGFAYPEGPYGIDKGATIRDFIFTGYANPADGMGEPNRVTIALGHFYNPTGEGSYPEGSPYGAGEPLPRALMIMVSAVYCPPCNAEAEEIRKDGKHAHYKARGGEFMLDLVEGTQNGEPATFQHLESWAQAYDVTYPSVIDPSYQLGGLFDTSSYPANLIVDTRDITIVEAITGKASEGFWLTLDEVLE